MRKLTLFAMVLIGLVSCKQEPKDYVSFSGKITNKNSNALTITNRAGYKKVIEVAEDGSFKDTLKVEKGVYNLFDGKEYTSIFFKNGDDIKMTIDTKEFDETIAYTGAGSEENNFLAKSALLREGFFNDENLLKLPKVEFDSKVTGYVNDFKSLLSAKKLEESFVKNQEESIENFKQYVNRNYEQEQYIKTNLAQGKLSPKFVDYENNAGGTTSLEDLKGKYVYIDVWATWCKPCKNEIPHLKKVEKEFHDKNIEFVSISIDNKKDHEAWKKMIVDKEMVGVQLFADNNWQSKFVTDYAINGIPRFILIDPEGNIVDARAPRPSDAKLLDLLKSLNI
ncbi:Thiol-disulfide isomerase or thioredoxin [Tenacibaculum sp. 190524A02b]|uniref:Thiol-disulfide isomerase or thioredoxin n=1 Tax=Tenacibaculum vairaonense TaxID=3137860 RepID=A0ABM9PMH5_9FLAO